MRNFQSTFKASVYAGAFAFLSLACVGSAGAVKSAAAYQASSASASAPSANVSTKEQARLTALLFEKVKIAATKVEVSPIPGFFEMTAGPNIYYMDSAGKWLFDGHLVDMDTRTSVTAVKKSNAANQNTPALDWSSLNLTDAVKTVYGKATPGRVIATFEDPNCGYCRRLHSELAKLPNMTIYTFQISLMGATSQSKNEAVWCAKDRSAAWGLTMQGQDVKAEASCDASAIARNGEVAKRLGVSGTPTIFFVDGSRQPGAMDAQAIEAKLNSTSAAPKPR